MNWQREMERAAVRIAFGQGYLDAMADTDTISISTDYSSGIQYSEYTWEPATTSIWVAVYHDDGSPGAIKWFDNENAAEFITQLFKD